MRAFRGHLLPAAVLLLCWSVVSAADPAAESETPRRAAAKTEKTSDGQFTPLVPLPKPAIINSAAAYPGGSFNADNLLDGVADGSRQSEYASAGKGTETFVDFDFGKPTPVAAFKHVDRFDPATVDTADLVFSDQADFSRAVATVPLKHANTRGGVTFVPFAAVTARYVRWQVTSVGPHGTVGGAEISFFTAAEPETVPTRTTVELTGLPALLRADGGPLQPLRVTVRYPYAEPAKATLAVAGADPLDLELKPEGRTIDIRLPAVEADTPVEVKLAVAGRSVVESKPVLKPVRPWVLYFLPHSHVDIGYTHVQTEVERMQWKHLEQAIELARRTADYPPEARFRWNTEVLWAVDGYLKQAPPERRGVLLEAVRRGSIHLDGLYGNELTGLCRPEELFRLLDCARRLARQHDLVIDSAMISDVPGYTWGIVPALAQSGVRYFSIGPNHIHRIGYTLADWGDRAFYWKSPSGQDKVLCWMAGRAYSWFHGGRLGDVQNVEPRAIFEYLKQLEDSGYPYDMVQVRYSIGGDNGPPDPNLPEFVKAWNAKYQSPKLVIATTSRMFHEFERRYGDQVPEVRGDFTPYWEDGAGSSARETALARSAAERLIQAEALWAMLNPGEYPTSDFYAAWQNVILYNEHTWGAHSSISQPDSQFTKDQWKIKQAFALGASTQSRELLSAALAGRTAKADKIAALDVYNTNSWPRTDLVILARGVSAAGDVVKDALGRAVPSQRDRDGRLMFLARDLPPLGAARFLLESGETPSTGGAKAEAGVLSTRSIRLEVDRESGAISSLTVDGAPLDLVDRDAGIGLNEYLYVPSRNPENVVGAAGAEVTVKHPGPLVASLSVRCEAPGCRSLTRELRVVDGLDRVDVINVLDKENVRTKESVHFGFAFNVPDGVMRLDVPWGVIRPEQDQLPGACKNYFSAGRWVDVSNADFGVTWATVDAPLVEIGGITVDVADPFEPQAWIRHVEPTQTFLSYVMNNYWETNYKASQEGVVVFRYSIMPHRQFDAAVAARFGIERSQPLVAVPADPNTPPAKSLFRVEPESVIVSSLKPSEDGKAWIGRLFNAGEVPVQVTLSRTEPPPMSIARSSPFEEKGPALTGPIELPGFGIVTLRIELPD